MEISVSGIKCDNSACDFKDVDVAFEDYPQWINRPCTKCGSNLLTEDDYKTTVALYDLSVAIQTLPEGTAELLLKAMDHRTDEQRETDTLALCEKFGLQDVGADTMLHLTLDTHDGINVTDVQKFNEPLSAPAPLTRHTMENSTAANNSGTTTTETETHQTVTESPAQDDRDTDSAPAQTETAGSDAE